MSGETAWQLGYVLGKMMLTPGEATYFVLCGFLIGVGLWLLKKNRGGKR